MQKIYELDMDRECMDELDTNGLDMDKEFAEFMKEKDEQEIKDSDFEENINYFEAVFASWRYDEYYEEEI